MNQIGTAAGLTLGPFAAGILIAVRSAALALFGLAVVYSLALIPFFLMPNSLRAVRVKCGSKSAPLKCALKSGDSKLKTDFSACALARLGMAYHPPRLIKEG